MDDIAFADGPNKTSCTNTSYTEGVSMHYFPSDESAKQSWIKFVRRHRKDFIPSKSSALCSVHFEDSCFELRAAVLSPESEIKFKRFLVKGAIPTRDTVVPYSSPESKRKRRKVSPLLYSFAVLDGTSRTSSGTLSLVHPFANHCLLIYLKYRLHRLVFLLTVAGKVK